MKRLSILFFTVAFLTLLALKPPTVIHEQQLRTDYYEIISNVQQLFREHSMNEEGKYYNRNFQTREEVAVLLEGQVTEKGIDLIIDEVFTEVDSLLYYKENFQEYLHESRDYYLHSSSMEVTYYSTVKNTILNPALRMISFDYINKVKDNDRVVLEADSIEVRFYDENEGYLETDFHQYARYGYPAKEQISLMFSFLSKDGSYLLDSFQIETGKK